MANNYNESEHHSIPHQTSRNWHMAVDRRIFAMLFISIGSSRIFPIQCFYRQPFFACSECRPVVDGVLQVVCPYLLVDHPESRDDMPGVATTAGLPMNLTERRVRHSISTPSRVGSRSHCRAHDVGLSLATVEVSPPPWVGRRKPSNLQ